MLCFMGALKTLFVWSCLGGFVLKIVCNAQTGTIAFAFPDSTANRTAGKICVTTLGQPGTCKSVLQCDFVLKASGKNPQICHWEDTVPVVCCPDSGPSEAQSTTKRTTVGSTSTARSTTTTPFRRSTAPGSRPRRGTLEFVDGNCGEAPVRSKKAKRQTEENGTREFLGREQTPFIVGGRNAEPYPWMAAIFYFRVPGKASYHCGGTLVTDQLVLTAAHCFNANKDPRKYQVRLGEVDLENDDAGEKPVTLELKAIRVHSGYSIRRHYDDIALLKLEKPVETTSNIHQICFPGRGYGATLDDGENVYVAGWGHQTFGGKTTSRLQEAMLPVVERDKCQTAFQKLAAYKRLFPNGFEDRFICAGKIGEGGVDACQGDSGGPLMLDTDRRQWVLVGIVAFGVECGRPDFPGVYTRVHKYMDWIKTTKSQLDRI